ncbi:MAG: glycosyltransferase [Thermoflavifilum sp.]|nr:glycosyltransferase [Thermoflavifilum sp.]
MHILYLISLDNQHDAGKIYKIRDRLAYWRKAGHRVNVWVLSRDHEEEIRGLSGLDGVKVFHALPFHFPFRQQFSWVKKAERYVRQALALHHLTEEIASLNPDLIYYHQHIWLPGLAGLLKRYPSVMEVNVIDTEEVKFTPLVRRWIYRAGRKSLIRAVDGLVCVTPEITARFEKYHKLSCTISNGIDLQRIPLKKIDPCKKAHLIFVGSSDIPSQGIDLVMALAKKLPQFVFHVVCPDLPPGHQQNIISHGALNDIQLANLYAKMDIGIGTLALYRKHMHQACPLKVREYIAAGLPLILAYEDCDLPVDPHILQIPNKPFSLDDAWISKIENFVEANRMKRLPESIRQRVALERKETIRLAFFEKILHRCRTKGLHPATSSAHPAFGEAIPESTAASSFADQMLF